MQVPHTAQSQLKSAHAHDAGLKPRAKELPHSMMFNTHQGNDLQFISALWLLCQLLNVTNITTVSRERPVYFLPLKSTFMPQLWFESQTLKTLGFPRLTITPNANMTQRTNCTRTAFFFFCHLEIVKKEALLKSLHNAWPEIWFGVLLVYL